MKRINKFILTLTSLLLCMVLVGCTNPLTNLIEEVITTTRTLSSTSQTVITSDTYPTKQSPETEEETSFIPNFVNSNAAKTTTQPIETTTEVTTSEKTEKSNGLLQAEDFTIQDINKNGPLYNRRDQFDPAFIEEALDYFPEIAGGNEFDSSIGTYITRWDLSIPIKIALFGDFTDDDLDVLDMVVETSEVLTNLDINYVETSDDYNYEFHITPLNEFDDIFPNYVEGNWGYVSFWNDDYYIRYYTISAVSNDYPNRQEMNHLIIEEFVQSLGLPNDSYRYEDSIFQQNWTDVQEPLPIDWLLLEFVYRPELSPGMDVEECVDVLRELYLN